LKGREDAEIMEEKKEGKEDVRLSRRSVTLGI
jgi:hypothetical protein